MERYTRDRLGRIAELLTEIKLLEVGWDVYRPSLDLGVDLVAGPHRFQVKGAQRSTVRPIPYYVYKLKGKSRLVDFADVDFLVLYGREDDLWLIVPTSLLKGRVPEILNLPLVPSATKPRSAWLEFYDYRDRWPRPGE